MNQVPGLIKVFTSLPVLSAMAVSVTMALMLFITKKWHGHLSMDSESGIQKVHTAPTPRVGGVAIIIGVIAGAILSSAPDQELFFPLLLAGVPAFAVGLLEDVTKRVSVRTRLLATMACGVLGWIITGLSVVKIEVPGLDWLLSFQILSVVFTAFAVGGMANAVNIIDGFNGLASGSVCIILTGFGVIAWSHNDIELAHICLVLAGAMLGFFLINWPFGKIFLGDGGAYFMGFALAWVAVLLTSRHSELSAWAPLLLCAYPILEVLFSMVRRRKRRLSLGGADRLHLHSLVKRRLIHRLMPDSCTLARNSVTGATMWIAALIPVLIGLRWSANTIELMIGFVIYGLTYFLIYARLIQFRWPWETSVSAVLSPTKN